MFAQARLYGILDLAWVPAESAPGMLRKLLAGGVDLVQVRAKNYALADLAMLTSQLLPIAAANKVPLLVNDEPEVAQSVPVDGVHVGQDDLPIAEVRQRAGRPILVGKSTHSLAQAIAAEGEGADYIGFGPLFATPTKPDYRPIGLDQIKAVHDAVSIPIFCIGGIKLENLPQVLAAGARRVVIVSGLLLAPDPADYARRAKTILRDHDSRFPI